MKDDRSTTEKHDGKTYVVIRNGLGPPSTGKRATMFFT
jgi:hypothetical protein